MLRATRLATLLLSALGLILGGAHALELPPKLTYDAELYTRVTSTLYWMFGSVGAAIQIGALLSSAFLTLLVRGLPSFRWTLLGTLALLLSLILWGVLVAPVNAQWERVLAESPAAAPDLYLRLRPRWEYGHLAAFAAWLLGYVLLLISVLPPVAIDRGSSPRHS
jgi:hypothetical protein